MKLSWVFDLLPRLFPANDIQVNSAERMYGSLSAKADTFKCSYCPVNDGVPCLQSCEDALADYEAETEALEAEEERQRVGFSCPAQCHVHHRSPDACASLHVDVPASSPLVVDKPSVSVVEPGTGGTSTLLQNLADELRDAVGDNYDHLTTNVLWHDEGIGEAVDWEAAAKTLLLYFDITEK